MNLEYIQCERVRIPSYTLEDVKMRCTDYNQFLGYGAKNKREQPEPRKEECPKCHKKFWITWSKQRGTIWGGDPADNWFMFLPRH